MLATAWRIEETRWPANPPAAVHAFGGEHELAWLDSADSGAGGSRFGFVGARPIALVEQFEDQAARLVAGGRTLERHANGWHLWRAVHRRLPTLPPSRFGLAPGWVGYLGFESARQLERLPATRRDDFGLPTMRLALYDRGVVLDHLHRRAFAMRAPEVPHALGLPPDGTGAANDEDWIGRWNEAASADREVSYDAEPRLACDMPQAEYEQMVRRALEYIAAGDIYQVNLAQRLRLSGIGDPLAAYAAIRSANKAPYGALLRWDDGAIASASPELFLQVRDGAVLTSPIKGTRPRTGDPVLDEINRRQLLDSPKDAAELAMIVDLHRNDLGRVCAYGSIRVAEPRRLEAHPSVLHTVADVCGRLAPGRDAIDLLAACFPAGSVTGVPKIRAIQIIDELEPVTRGAFTGAIGALGLDGQITFSVAIRTVQIRGQTGMLHVGGGIVADSDPADEYAETLAKARGILDALLITNYELRRTKDAIKESAGR